MFCRQLFKILHTNEKNKKFLRLCSTTNKKTMSYNNNKNDDDDEDTKRNVDDNIDYDVTVLGCDQFPLHYACRTGRYEQVQYLLDILGYDTFQKINEVDDHNATPLYYAALVGNTRICTILLHHGAICNEHDSARVFYVALTSQLRTMLREWSLSAATIDPYIQSLYHNFITCNNYHNNNNDTLLVTTTSSTTADTVINDVHTTSSTSIDTTDCTINIWLINKHRCMQNDEHGSLSSSTTTTRSSSSTSTITTTTATTTTKSTSNILLYKSISVHRIMIQFRYPFMLLLLLDQKTTGNVNSDLGSNSNNSSTTTPIIDLYGNDIIQCDVYYRLIEYIYSGKIEVVSYTMAVVCYETIQQQSFQWHCEQHHNQQQQQHHHHHHHVLYTKLQSMLDQYETRVCTKEKELLATKGQLHQQYGDTDDVNNATSSCSTTNQQVEEITKSYIEHQADTANPFILASLLVTPTTTSTSDTNHDENEINQGNYYNDNGITDNHKNKNNNDVVPFRTCIISDIDLLRSDMKRMAEMISIPISINKSQVQQQKQNNYSDLTIFCNDDQYFVHQFRLMQQSDYIKCALSGNFIEASTCQLDLTSFVSSSTNDDCSNNNNNNVVSYILQWMYADCFLHPEDVSIPTAVEIIQLSMVLLCSSRLPSYVVNTIIIPNLSFENVFDMIDYTRTYLPLVGNTTIVDRLECKCCEVLALHIEDIFRNTNNNDTMTTTTTKYEDMIRYIVDQEIQMTRQGGDMNTIDIPFIAEIRRAIQRMGGITRTERDCKLHLLYQFVNNIHCSTNNNNHIVEEQKQSEEVIDVQSTAALQSK